MEISTSVEHGSVPVTILRPEGRVDGQNYRELIARVGELYKSGVRDVLLDMSEVTYVSSAGLVALHTIALLLEGAPLPDLENGWHVLKRTSRASEAGIQKHLKLLNVRPEVHSVLDMAGFTAFLDAFDDKEAALQAF